MPGHAAIFSLNGVLCYIVASAIASVVRITKGGGEGREGRGGGGAEEGGEGGQGGGIDAADGNLKSEVQQKMVIIQ